MGISIQNNSMLHLDELVDMYKHYLVLVDKSKISSVKFYDDCMEIFCDTKLIAKFHYGKSYVGNGSIFFFNQLKGEGVIKANNGDFLSFSDSSLESSEVILLPGDKVKFKLASDTSVVGHIGAVNIRKVA